MPTTPPAQTRRDSAAPVRVQRWDRVQLSADLDPAARTAQGYLRTHAAIAVPGIMEYQDAEGNITLELIPEEELHDPASLHSLAGLPVTLQHPVNDVTPDNVGSLGVGSIGNDVEILQESGHVRVLLMIHRRDALDAINSGIEEVSPGYTAFIDPTPGVHEIFGRYDAVQRQRRYNHLAVVDEARGGPTVKLRADGRQAVKRLDALPAQTPAPAAAPTPAPAPPRGTKMHSLILLAALAALPYTTRADGKCVKRNDEDGATFTEEELVAAISGAIQDLQAKASAGEEASAAAAEMEGTDEDPAAMKARIGELEGELAALKQASADAAQVEMDAAETAEQGKLDGLAQRMHFDSSSWTADTDSNARRLDLCRHAELVGADDTPEAAVLIGMVRALDAKGATRKVDAWDGLRSDGTKPAGKPADAQPTLAERRADEQARKDAADPMKASIRKKRAAASA